jgi:PAS domain S-box-containing protein
MLLPDYRVRQRDHLLAIAQALTQRLELETVLQRILAAATDLLDAQAALIALRREVNDPPAPMALTQFYIATQHGMAPGFLAKFDTLLRQLTLSPTEAVSTVIVEIQKRLQRVAHLGPYDLSHTVGLPLLYQNRLIGLLLVLRSHPAPFDNESRQILQTFANQAAIAVANAQLYEQVTQQKTRLDAILDGAADGILVMDYAHRVQQWNRSLVKLTGVAANHAIGKPYSDSLRWLVREQGIDLLEAEANGWPLTFAAPLYNEGYLQLADGKSVAVGVTFAPIFDSHQKLANIVASVRDITRFREAERLKSTFISIISHELKTPVSLIKGYAGTLRREDAHWDLATIQDSLAVIEEEADRLNGLIQNLLDASRLQAGGLHLDQNEVMLPELLTGLARSFRIQSEKHTISVEFSLNFPPIVADEERLRQVFSNLLSNALKYSPDGGEIHIQGHYEPNSVQVTVTDHGAGIPTHELTAIFDRFHRADTAVTRRAQGAGLGLYLARAIVQAHGGQIWAESEVGRGTTFFVRLPRQSQPIPLLRSPNTTWFS